MFEPEQLTADAAEWLNEYLIRAENVEFQGVLEGMSDEEWSSHLEFVSECFRHGMKPTAYADQILRCQKLYNEALMTPNPI